MYYLIDYREPEYKVKDIKDNVLLSCPDYRVLTEVIRYLVRGNDVFQFSDNLGRENIETLIEVIERQKRRISKNDK